MSAQAHDLQGGSRVSDAAADHVVSAARESFHVHDNIMAYMGSDADQEHPGSYSS